MYEWDDIFVKVSPTSGKFKVLEFRFLGFLGPFLPKAISAVAQCAKPLKFANVHRAVNDFGLVLSVS